MRVEIYMDSKRFKYVFSQKKLRMRRRRWHELMADYDIDVQYHPGNFNVVPDTLNGSL